VAEWSRSAGLTRRTWLPDLAVGWTFIACGLPAWSRRPESRIVVLLTVTGVPRFVGNFAESPVFPYRAIAARLFITERTVEAHVKQVFLNLRARGDPESHTGASSPFSHTWHGQREP
jgi:hypothetical protein